MKGTLNLNPITKTAKTRPKNGQHRRTANCSRTRLRALTRQKNNITLRQHRRSAGLSKKELSDLIGPKINKKVSCTSVSQKRNYSHVARSVNHHRQLNRPISRFKKCNKPHKTEVSHKIRSPIRSYVLRHNHITPPGYKISQTLAPPRARESRFPDLGKVRLYGITIEIIKVLKSKAQNA